MGYRIQSQIYAKTKPDENKLNEELSTAYGELYFSRSKVIQETRARKTIESAQNNFNTPVSTEMLITSLNLIDLNDPKNILLLINILNTNSAFKNELFDIPVLTEFSNISNLELDINIENISPEILRAELSPKEYNEYQKNKDSWLNDPIHGTENKKKLNSIIETANNHASLLLKISKTQLKEKLLDADFGYNLFARWNVNNIKQIIPASILKDLALRNPGIALGILINPNLRKILLPTLNQAEKSTLLNNAQIASAQNPKHQHYFRVTFDLLSDEKNFLSSLLFSHNPAQSLRTELDALAFLKGDNNSITIKKIESLHTFIEQSGSILSTFADQLPDKASRETTLTEVIHIFKPHIETLIEKYESEVDVTKKAALKHQIDLLFSKPEISDRLNISPQGLLGLYIGDKSADEKKGPKIGLENVLNNKDDIKLFVNQFTKFEDHLAFVIVNTPSLWVQLNPQPSPVISTLMKIGDSIFGGFTDLFKDNTENEKKALADRSPIFAKKLKGEMIAPPIQTTTLASPNANPTIQQPSSIPNSPNVASTTQQQPVIPNSPNVSSTTQQQPIIPNSPNVNSTTQPQTSITASPNISSQTGRPKFRSLINKADIENLNKHSICNLSNKILADSTITENPNISSDVSSTTSCFKPGGNTTIQ